MIHSSLGCTTHLNYIAERPSRLSKSCLPQWLLFQGATRPSLFRHSLPRQSSLHSRRRCPLSPRRTMLMQTSTNPCRHLAASTPRLSPQARKRFSRNNDTRSSQTTRLRHLQLITSAPTRQPADLFQPPHSHRLAHPRSHPMHHLEVTFRASSPRAPTCSAPAWHRR